MLKNNINFSWYIFGIFLIVQLSKISANNLPSCIVDEDDSLEDKLSECHSAIFKDFRWYSNGAVYYSNDKRFSELPVKEISPNDWLFSDEYGNKSCSKVFQVILGDSKKRSTCPVHYVDAFRYNVYPFSQFYSICNCKKCLLNEPNDSYVCKPMYLNMPAFLRRKNNLESEISIWDPVLERVPVSCHCEELVDLN